jgi:hypothetical protein
LLLPPDDTMANSSEVIARSILFIDSTPPSQSQNLVQPEVLAGHQCPPFESSRGLTVMLRELVDLAVAPRAGDSED